MPGKEESTGAAWRTLQEVYRGRLRSGRGTRARVYGRADRETGAREPKKRERKPTRGSRNCESAKRGWGMAKGRVLGRTEGTIRQTGSGRTENERARSGRRGRAKKQRRESWAEGKPKTRGCGTGAGIYEQVGTRARTKERAEEAGGKLVWGCFAFLIGLKHANATPSRKTTLSWTKIGDM